MRKPAFSVKEVSYRKVKAIDINAFRKDLQQSDLLCCEAHGNWTILFPAIIPFFPVSWISTLLLSRKPLPCGHANPGLMIPSRQQREMAANVSASGEPVAWNQIDGHLLERDHVNHVIERARRDYYANFINHENSTDQRSLFNAVNRLFGGSGDELYPP